MNSTTRWQVSRWVVKQFDDGITLGVALEVEDRASGARRQNAVVITDHSPLQKEMEVNVAKELLTRWVDTHDVEQWRGSHDHEIVETHDLFRGTFRELLEELLREGAPSRAKR